MVLKISKNSCSFSVTYTTLRSLSAIELVSPLTLVLYSYTFLPKKPTFRYICDNSLEALNGGQ